MLKHHSEQISFLIRVTDVFLGGVAFWSAYTLRNSFLFENAQSIPTMDEMVWILVASTSLRLFLFPIFGFYESIRYKKGIDLIKMVFKALVVEFFLLGSLVFFFQAKETSRSFFGLYLLSYYFLLSIQRFLARGFLSAIRKRGFNFRRMLIVGVGDNAEQVIRFLKKSKHLGCLPIGCLIPDSETPFPKEELEEVPVLGNLSELEKITLSQPIDEVIFAIDRIEAQELHHQVNLSQMLGIPARFSLGMFDLPHSKVTLSMWDHLPMMTFYTTLRTPLEDFLKRFLDVTIAVVGLILTAFLYPWIAYRIRKESPGSVIFKQTRVGENGRRFKCYKFRTMELNAENQKKELLSQNTMQGPIFKIEKDPRIFSFGEFLRKSSLDELPQFFNILRGDMSVVGTRPPTPDEVLLYEPRYRRRLSIRPGLTGLWQVSGRSNITKFEHILDLDLQYIDRWSIFLDFQIILKTIWVTIFRRGAC